MEAEKNNDKDGKELYKLMNNAIYIKTIENMRNRINLKLVSNKKDYSKKTSKQICMSQKVLENNLVLIRKIKRTLKLNKPAYNGMFILELSKVVIYKSHYDYIKNNMTANQN